jgi:hypothetical protein
VAADLHEDEKTTPDIHHRDCESVQFDYGGVALGPCNCGIPTLVLTDLAAKRRIVKEHEHVSGRGVSGGPESFGRAVCHLDEGYVLSLGWCQTVRLLALPYADRDGYDPAWAPSIYGVAADGDPEGPLPKDRDVR